MSLDINAIPIPIRHTSYQFPVTLPTYPYVGSKIAELVRLAGYPLDNTFTYNKPPGRHITSVLIHCRSKPWQLAMTWGAAHRPIPLAPCQDC